MMSHSLIQILTLTLILIQTNQT